MRRSPKSVRKISLSGLLKTRSIIILLFPTLPDFVVTTSATTIFLLGYGKGLPGYGLFLRTRYGARESIRPVPFGLPHPVTRS